MYGLFYFFPSFFLSTTIFAYSACHGGEFYFNRWRCERLILELKQCLLVLKEMEDNNSEGSKMYSFVIIGKNWPK